MKTIEIGSLHCILLTRLYLSVVHPFQRCLLIHGNVWTEESVTEKYGSELTLISVFERIPSCLSGIVWIIHPCSHSILCLDGQHVASEISPQHESSWTGCSGEGHTVSLGSSSQLSFMMELYLIKYSSSSRFMTGSVFWVFLVFRLKYELKNN